MIAYFRCLLLLAVYFSSCAYADDLSDKDLQKVKEQLQASFSAIRVNDFKPGPIDGSYEINMGNGIVYYFPKNEMLVFGEIFNKDGESLTRKSFVNFFKEKMKRLPIKSGVVVGDPNGKEVIEITDPDCPYCQRYEKFIETLSLQKPIKRIIFFETRMHPNAKAKVIHVLCSEDKLKALQDMFNGVSVELKTCDHAENQLKEQQQVIHGLGISATPTIIIDDRLIPGFKPEIISNYLNHDL